eukprot:scaffold15486_cov111-Isochrysis_galbana.AAC.4
MVKSRWSLGGHSVLGLGLTSQVLASISYFGKYITALHVAVRRRRHRLRHGHRPHQRRPSARRRPLELLLANVAAHTLPRAGAGHLDSLLHRKGCAGCGRGTKWRRRRGRCERDAKQDALRAEHMPGGPQAGDVCPGTADGHGGIAPLVNHHIKAAVLKPVEPRGVRDSPSQVGQAARPPPHRPDRAGRDVARYNRCAWLRPRERRRQLGCAIADHQNARPPLAGAARRLLVKLHGRLAATQPLLTAEARHGVVKRPVGAVAEDGHHAEKRLRWRV